jgi:nicotinate-nucleotide pyrophosphorylase (carboxylating)
MGSGKENTSQLISAAFLKSALKEDLGRGDITTDSLISKKQMGKGHFLAKQDLVLSGSFLISRIFHLLDRKIKISLNYQDGDFIKKGTRFGEVTGPFHSLLKGERTTLNLLQRLSGISTLTHRYNGKIKGHKTKILDTRKTLPIYRHLEKYAVRMGGGVNHRIGLYDQMLIKDNHIAACGGNIEKATQKARRSHPTKKLVVEIQTPDQIEPAIEAGADRLLLDNMTNAQIKKCMKLVRKRVPIEVSGQVNLGRISQLSRIGVDFISIGAITHSAPAADISLKIVPIEPL